MPDAAELRQLEASFLSGKNPRAYLPLCQALRRMKRYRKALEICERGLAADANSTAGQTLHARLLIDLGHYEDALRGIARAEQAAPDAMGLLLEKARVLILLHRYPEAREIMGQLTARNPMSADVQVLARMLADAERGQRFRTQASTDIVPRLYRKSPRDILEAILAEMKTHVTFQSAALIPTEAGEPALVGNPAHAESALAAIHGMTESCRDLEQGTPRRIILETATLQLIVLVRGGYIGSFSLDQTRNFGKIYSRLMAVAHQIIPGKPTRDLSEPTGST